jgi:hypothetical protein
VGIPKDSSNSAISASGWWWLRYYQHYQQPTAFALNLHKLAPNEHPNWDCEYGITQDYSVSFVGA